MVDWPHAPIHRFTASGVFFVTGATYLKCHYYHRPDRLDSFADTLFALAREHAVTLQAWTLFSNHYHLVAHAAGPSLRVMLAQLHSIQARACNSWDQTPGRRVWYQFRETELTYPRSWLARLRYTNENPVRHGLVPNAVDYPWYSARWLEANASPAFRASLARVRVDRVHVDDAFEPTAIGPD